MFRKTAKVIKFYRFNHSSPLILDPVKMPLIVQKFGGTSVADPKKILAAARKAVRAHQQGSQVVVVVSAMGKNTDGLIDLAKQITDKPAAREMDKQTAHIPRRGFIRSPQIGSRDYWTMVRSSSRLDSKESIKT